MGCVSSTAASEILLGSAINTTQSDGKRRHTMATKARSQQPTVVKKKKTPRTITTTSSKTRTFSGSTSSKRMPDRSPESSLSTDSSGTAEYIDRLQPNAEDDKELALEITRRQNSAVRSKVNKYDQLDAKSRCVAPLVDVRKQSLSQKSQIYTRVQSFEIIDRESKVEYGPPLAELKRRREMHNPNRFSKSDAFTGLVFSL